MDLSLFVDAVWIPKFVRFIGFNHLVRNSFESVFYQLMVFAMLQNSKRDMTKIVVLRMAP